MIITQYKELGRYKGIRTQYKNGPRQWNGKESTANSVNRARES